MPPRRSSSGSGFPAVSGGGAGGGASARFLLLPNPIARPVPAAMASPLIILLAMDQIAVSGVYGSRTGLASEVRCCDVACRGAQHFPDELVSLDDPRSRPIEILIAVGEKYAPGAYGPKV